MHLKNMHIGTRNPQLITTLLCLFLAVVILLRQEFSDWEEMIPLWHSFTLTLWKCINNLRFMWTFFRNKFPTNDVRRERNIAENFCNILCVMIKTDRSDANRHNEECWAFCRLFELHIKKIFGLITAAYSWLVGRWIAAEWDETISKKKWEIYWKNMIIFWLYSNP